VRYVTRPTCTMSLSVTLTSTQASGTQVRGFDSCRSRRIFQGEQILIVPSFGGEVKPSVPCRRFAACKKSLIWRGSRHLSAKLPDISHLQFPLSLLEVSGVGGDVGAPGGASGHFQSRVRTISLHGCGTSGGSSLRALQKEKEVRSRCRRTSY
jgi:hypothetical protein